MENSYRIFFCSCFLFVGESIADFPSKTSSKKSAEIISARSAKPGEFPFIASVSLEDIVLYPICSGAIVGPLVVLTAASCLGSNASSFLKNLVVTAGTNYLNPNETTSLVRRNVAKVIIHPKYKGAVMPHDLSILTVSEKFHFDSRQWVTKATMASVPLDDGTVCQLLGWGLEFNFNVTIENIPLKVTNVHVYNSEMCEFIYRVKVYRSQLCSERASLYIGFCATDVGSPLVCDEKLYGIGSLYINCTNPMEPNLFANIPSYKKYIILGALQISSSSKPALTKWTVLILTGVILK